MSRTRFQYFIHDERNRKRLDGPYASRKAALAASVKFNAQSIPTVILRFPILP